MVFLIACSNKPTQLLPLIAMTWPSDVTMGKSWPLWVTFLKVVFVKAVFISVYQLNPKDSLVLKLCVATF